MRSRPSVAHIRDLESIAGKIAHCALVLWEGPAKAVKSVSLPSWPVEHPHKLQGPRRCAIADLVSFMRLLGRPLALRVDSAWAGVPPQEGLQ